MVIFLLGIVLFGREKVLANELVDRGYQQYNSFILGLSFIVTVILGLILLQPKELTVRYCILDLLCFFIFSHRGYIPLVKY